MQHDVFVTRVSHAHRWNPSVRAPASEALRTSRQADAARLLARMENNRNMGEDFALRDIVKLREMCQVG